MNLSTNLCGIKIDNPTILASGILGVTKSSLKNIAKNGAGAVTMKSISKEPRKGHPNPIITTFEAGMMNAVGYSNPGIEEAKKEFVDLKDVGAPVIASIIGSTADDFAYMAKRFLTDEFAAVEIPLSCPHTPGFGTLAGQGTPKATSDITKAVVKNTKLPVFVKVSPNIPKLADVAKAAEEAGAAAITAINTAGPGMIINIETGKPILANKFGGVSGPAIKPIAVRCVYDIYKAVKIPIIGLGGINTGRDAIEMMMAGATAVGIGTGIYYRGPEIFKKVADEIKEFMKEQDYKNLKEIIGIAHE
ncbi:dihydroorotate dehydrogenase [Patescibacteria group bacterium]|nr:dihydroorotate dehydrogenase [Patescibacteria group bacterium]